MSTPKDVFDEVMEKEGTETVIKRTMPNGEIRSVKPVNPPKSFDTEGIIEACVHGSIYKRVKPLPNNVEISQRTKTLVKLSGAAARSVIETMLNTPVPQEQKKEEVKS